MIWTSTPTTVVRWLDRLSIKSTTAAVALTGRYPLPIIIDDDQQLALTPILEDLIELQLSSTKKAVRDDFALSNRGGHISETLGPSGNDILSQVDKDLQVIKQLTHQFEWTEQMNDQHNEFSLFSNSQDQLVESRPYQAAAGMTELIGQYYNLEKRCSYFRKLLVKLSYELSTAKV